MNACRDLVRFGLLCAVSFPFAATQDRPTAAFDVSIVKPHDPADQTSSWQMAQDGFRAMNVNFTNIVAGAWGLRLDQVTGGPAWAEDLHWDVTVKSTELTTEQMEKLTIEQKDQMMQKLLTERFHLQAHLETRAGPVFTLLPAKGGIKLTPIPMTAEEKAAGKVAGSHLRMRGGGGIEMEATKVTLTMLLRNLAANLRRTVIDKTGLPDNAVYNFTLHWAPDFGSGPSPDSDAMPLPAALQEQLGLRLEAGRGPVQVLVIDHVEKPTEN